MATISSLLAALMASGCHQSSQARATAPADAANAPAPPPPESAREGLLRAGMQGHENLGEAMRDAVARGDLEEAKGEARLLAEFRIDLAGSELWRRMLESMKSAAARVASANDLKDASHGVAAVAKTCGDCHTVLGRPGMIVGPGGPPGPDVSAFMRRHEWAAQRLWDGLVVPSDEAWKWGATMLSEAPLAPERLTPGQSPVPKVGALEQTVRALASKAADVERPDIRADIYGDMLATCAECHQWLGGPTRAAPR